MGISTDDAVIMESQGGESGLYEMLVKVRVAVYLNLLNGRDI